MNFLFIKRKKKVYMNITNDGLYFATAIDAYKGSVFGKREL